MTPVGASDSRGQAGGLSEDLEQVANRRPAGRGGGPTSHGESNTVRVRYFAGARAASGVSEESIRLPMGATVRDALTSLTARHGERLAKVLVASSFLLDGVAVRDQAITLDDGVNLDVLPPFAGG